MALGVGFGAGAHAGLGSAGARLLTRAGCCLARGVGRRSCGLARTWHALPPRLLMRLHPGTSCLRRSAQFRQLGPAPLRARCPGAAAANRAAGGWGSSRSRVAARWPRRSSGPRCRRSGSAASGCRRRALAAAPGRRDAAGPEPSGHRIRRRPQLRWPALPPRPQRALALRHHPRPQVRVGPQPAVERHQAKPRRPRAGASSRRV